MKSDSRPTAYIRFDRSFYALSSEILSEVQSSLFMEFLILENWGAEKGFPETRGPEKNPKTF